MKWQKKVAEFECGEIAKHFLHERSQGPDYFPHKKRQDLLNPAFTVWVESSEPEIFS